MSEVRIKVSRSEFSVGQKKKRKTKRNNVGAI
jgi:hypothetical protein